MTTNSHQTAQAYRKLDGIQVLRGVAALAVALFHFHAIERVYGPDQLTGNVFEYGRVGVDLFFVISGFIMVHVAGKLAPSGANAGSFLIKRALRIYPPYWVVTVGLLMVWLGSGKAFFGGVIGEAPNIPASFALWPTEREPALGVGWTLIHEMYFYIAFALILLLPVKLRAAGIAGWSLAIVAVWLSGARALPPVLALITSPLTLEFALGCAIAALRPRIPASLLPFAGVAGLIWFAGAILVNGVNPDPAVFSDPMRRAISFGPAGALVLLGMTVQGPRATGWPKASIRLGDWSYALYLVHVPVFAVMGVVWARFAGPGLTDNIIAMVLFVAAAIIISMIFYRLVEQPTLKLGTRLVGVRSRAASPTVVDVEANNDGSITFTQDELGSRIKETRTCSQDSEGTVSCR